MRWKKKKTFSFMRFFLLLSLLFFAPSCTKKKAVAPPPINVTAFKVAPQTVPAEFQFVGVAKSSHPVEIRARVESYLMTIDYTEGSQVKAGDLLFQLDPRQYEASLQEAKGVLARQEAILWRAKKSLERMAPLYEKNAVSERDLDNATAQVLAGEAEVISAKAKVELAELNLSYTQIATPINGLTGRALWREGSLITPSVNGLLTYVSVLDPIWVYFSVTESELLETRSEKQADQLILPEKQDYSVRLQLSDGSFFPYLGTVNFASPILDPDTGTMNVRATFCNPEANLMPGQFVQVYVSGAKRPNAIFVPQRSVVQGKKGKFVYVIDAQNKVHMQDVIVGPWFQDYWIIHSGLQQGDVVVDDGVNKIQNSSVVHITSFSEYKQANEGTS